MGTHGRSLAENTEFVTTWAVFVEFELPWLIEKQAKSDSSGRKVVEAGAKSIKSTRSTVQLGRTLASIHLEWCEHQLLGLFRDFVAAELRLVWQTMKDGEERL